MTRHFTILGLAVLPLSGNRSSADDTEQVPKTADDFEHMLKRFFEQRNSHADVRALKTAFATGTLRPLSNHEMKQFVGSLQDAQEHRFIEGNPVLAAIAVDLAQDENPV